MNEHHCERKVCSKGSDCPQNYECFQNICTINQCHDRKDCKFPNKYECIKGRCDTVECRDKSDCKVQGGADCIDFKCTKTCKDTKDCGNDGSQCLKFKCLFKKKEPYCYLDNQCKSRLCENGKCRKCKCKSESVKVKV